MPFISFIKSFKNSFISKERTVPGEQKEQAKAQTLPRTQPPVFAQAKQTALQNSVRHLQQAEREILTTKQTIVINSEGAPTPLIIRTPQRAPGKEQGQGTHHPGADFRSFLFELILETENLGPVFLRLDREGRLYNCTIYAGSKEIAAYLYQDFEDVRLLLADLLQKTSLGIGFLSLKDDRDPDKKHFIIDARV